MAENFTCGQETTIELPTEASVRGWIPDHAHCKIRIAATKNELFFSTVAMFQKAFWHVAFCG